MDINQLLGGTSAYGQDLGSPDGNLDLTAGGWGSTQAPALWGKWAGWAEGVARDSTGNALNAQVEGLSAGWQGAEQRWFRQAETSGLSRETASLMWGSVAPRFENQVAQAQSQREAQLGQQIGEIGTQAVGAIQNSIDYQDQLDQTNYWNQLFLDEQKKARKWGMIGSIAGLGMSALSFGATGGLGALAGIGGKVASTAGGGVENQGYGPSNFNPGSGFGGGSQGTWGPGSVGGGGVSPYPPSWKPAGGYYQGP